MHVAVLGAGLAGVTSAWYLRAAGFEVTVIDRQPGPGLETSFANGGQISVSHPEPWANPAAPATVLRWLGREDAPLLVRARVDGAMWRWALAFARECLPARTRRNTRAIAALARCSRERLRELRASTGIRYEHLETGILHLFRSTREQDEGAARAAALQRLGIDVVCCDATACEAIEPALARSPTRLAGGLFARDDESGDAHLFVLRLASLAAQAGVRFRYELAVEALAEEGGRVVGAQLKHADGRIEHFAADATVVCLGSYSARLLPPALLPQPVYPVKGYSITVPVSDPQRAPSVSLTEESRRIVCSRLGARLRVAGTAELAGYDLQPNAVRSAALLDWLDRHFPAAADLAAAEHWCGLRPATPSNVPLIGRSARAGLWLNTGHGTLGWTLACGSADNLARLMSGTSPLADFPFLGAGEA